MATDGDQVAPSYTPGLPSLAAGIGKADLTGGLQKTLLRPTYTQEQVYAALDAALDYNPDASYSAWVYELLGLQDWTLEVAGETGKVDEALTAEALAFTDRVMLAYGGGISTMLHVGMRSLMRRGAVCPELDVADSLDEVVDVDYVDPMYVDYQPVTVGNHKSLVPVYVPTTGGEPIPFNLAQFTVIAHGSRVGLPHGQSPMLPLVDAAYPYAELRDALQRVAKNQGWSRLAFIYAYDKVVASAPPDVVQVGQDGAVKVLDWEKLKAHIEAFRTDLEASVEDMYEDDNWILPDLIKPDSVGANHATESLDFAKLAQLFDQDAITAAKSQPAIHGRQWGSDLSSTGAVQWQVHALGVEALREYPARAVEWVIDQWLTITGRQGKANLVFPALRKEDRVEEANAAKTEAETAILLMDAGLIDNDEAAEMAVGHVATGTPAAPAGVADGNSGSGANGRATVATQLPLLTDNDRRSDEGRGVANTSTNGHAVADQHGAGCACDGCTEPLFDVRLEPFEPAVADAAGPIEMEQDPPPDEADAARIAREFDRWAEGNAPSFDGLYDAVVVTSAPEPETDTLARGNGHRAPAQTMPAGRWQWDETVSRWRYPPTREGRLGRLLPPDRADKIFERRMAERQRQAGEITQRYLDGKLTTREWQEAWQRVSKDAHLEARMIAVGGRNAMTFTDYGAAGGRIGAENRIIGAIGQQVAAGEMSAAQIREAVRRRFEANVRETYRRGREYAHVKAGYREERNLLEASAEHCAGCSEATARGWQSIGTLPAIGERDCKSGCACHMDYRVSEDQAMPAHRDAPLVPPLWTVIHQAEGAVFA